tara:strand:+ start:68 stop:862 length:795 start_codon:yes stop_codon:yes gene_type:complete
MFKKEMIVRKLIINLYKYKFLKRIVPSIFKIYLKIFNIQNINIKHKNVLLHLNLKNPIDREIYLKDNYEKKQIEFLISSIKKKEIKIFLDVGAHMGFYSIKIAKFVQRVYAFEPIKNNYNQFKKNMSINKIKNIKIFNTALSDTKKNIKMWVPDENKTGGFSVLDSTDLELKKYDQKKTFSIQSSSKKLDNILRIKEKKIAIKIDVERHEEKVIRGGVNLLTKNNVFLQVEIFPSKKKKVLHLLRSLKYSLIQKYGNDYFFTNY